MPTPRFVLIHGAYHGAWCWERLIPLLTARGGEGEVMIQAEFTGAGPGT